MGHLITLNSLVTPNILVTKFTRLLHQYLHLTLPGSPFFCALNPGPSRSFPSSRLRNVGCQPTMKTRCHRWELLTNHIGAKRQQTRMSLYAQVFSFFFFHFPNYNAFLYLFKLQTYYYCCEILPLRAMNELHWGQTMTDTQVSFFFMSFLFLSFFNEIELIMLDCQNTKLQNTKLGKIISTNCIKVTMIAHLSCLRGKRLSEHESTKDFLYERKWHTKPLM